MRSMVTSLKKQIISLRNEGKSYREIEKELDCSRATISYHCKNENLEDIGDKNKEITDELKNKINEVYKDNTADETAKKLEVSVSTVYKYSTIDKTELEKLRRVPDNIFDMSNRTKSKVMRRLIDKEGLKCSRCGWNEAIGDIHHIKGKDIENPHKHSNLAYLCPNCHRLFHVGKIDKDDIINFKDQVGGKWKKYYYEKKKNE